MIDLAQLEKDPDRVRKSLERRHATASLADVDRLVDLSVRRRALVTERDTLNAERNTLSAKIGGLMKQAGQDPAKAEEAAALKAKVQTGNVRIAAIEAELEQVDGERTSVALGLPNVLDDRVPPGKGDHDNVVVRTWGTIPAGEAGVHPQGGESHVEIGTRLGILDLERAAKLTGTRFWVLTGLGARLERALVNFFLDLHVGEHGYTEVMVPYIVHRKIAEGTGQLPKFEQDMFKLAAPLNGEDAFLIPTAEVPVTNLHRDEILDEAQLPIKYACFTPCFRSEAGSAGRDVRGPDPGAPVPQGRARVDLHARAGRAVPPRARGPRGDRAAAARAALPGGGAVRGRRGLQRRALLRPRGVAAEPGLPRDLVLQPLR
jgi:seryl-tRNA synthetase